MAGGMEVNGFENLRTGRELSSNYMSIEMVQDTRCQLGDSGTDLGAE